MWVEIQKMLLTDWQCTGQAPRLLAAQVWNGLAAL
jgi:hypothetical protein